MSSPAGHKLWVAGERVDADDFQGYLMDQVVPVFSSTAARDAAITAPAEGMVAMIGGSVDMLTVYNGSSWRDYLPYGPGTSHTPTLKQGASTNIAKTVNQSLYWRIGPLVYWFFDLAATAAGTAGSVVALTLPVAATNTQYACFGTITYYDAAPGTRYVCAAEFPSTTDLAMTNDGSGVNQLGVGPAVTVASGDVIRGFLLYPWV